MKKKIAALLAAVMAVTSISVSSMAASVTTINVSNIKIELDKVLIKYSKSVDISQLDEQDGIYSLASGSAVSFTS